jgi:predicted PurR-regulated permease PerM
LYPAAMRALVSVRLLAVLATAVVLALGRTFFVPVTLGLLLAAVLHPAVVAMRRVHVPASIGAAIAVLLSILALVLAVTLLEPPVRALTRDVPKTLVNSRRRLEALGLHLPGAAAPAPNGGRDSSSGTSGTSGSSGSTGIGQTVARAFGVTVAALFALVEIVLLAFFILAAGNAWSDKVRRAVRSPAEQHRVLDAVREIHHVVLRYLLVNVVINAAQGVLVALVVWPLGYTTPVIWGVLTFIAEFVPYFGGAVMVGLLFLTGLAGDGGLVHAAIAPAAYLVITTLQNNLISPAAYGRGLRLNPAAILIAVMFWGLLWGVAGVFLAVPLLAAMRVAAEHTAGLEPLAISLGD